MEKQDPLELSTDFLGEDRHDYVRKLAYQLCKERGCPFGSPEVDWLRAEQVVYSSLLASGLIASPANDAQDLESGIYS